MGVCFTIYKTILSFLQCFGPANTTCIYMKGPDFSLHLIVKLYLVVLICKLVFVQVFFFMLTGRMVIDWQLRRKMEDALETNGDVKQKKQD